MEQAGDNRDLFTETHLRVSYLLERDQKSQIKYLAFLTIATKNLGIENLIYTPCYTGLLFLVQQVSKNQRH